MSFSRFRVFTVLLSAIAMGVIVRGEDDDPQPTVPAPTSLVVTLKLPEVAVIGDHIHGEFIVKNTGATPVKIRAGERVGPLRPPDIRGIALADPGVAIDPWLRVQVWNERAKPLPDLMGGPVLIPSAKAPVITLAPGQSTSIYCPLENYVAILAQDIYTVSAWNDLGWLVDRAHPPLMATAEIIFKLPNAKYLAGRIRTLCAKDSTENTWELMHLWSPLFLPALRDEARGGHASACLGMSGIISEEANQVLLDFAASRDSALARTAAYALSTRLPSLASPGQPALRSWNGWAAREQILATWQPKFDAPLMTAAERLLESAPPSVSPSKKNGAGSSAANSGPIPNSVTLGARLVEARGSLDQAPAVLRATQRALDTNTTARKNSQAMITPPPLDALVGAMDALRSRGWRVDRADGAAAALAWFRQLADPKVERPADNAWQDAVRTALGSKSPILRENALRVVPVPISNAWEPLLRAALDDDDLGVQCAACAVAGNSGRRDFLSSLVNILVNGQQPEAQSAAARAAAMLGGGLVLWNALCDVIPEPSMTATALKELIGGTTEIPTASIIVEGNLTRSQAAAVHDAWKTFLTRNQELLQTGRRVPRGAPSITPTMMLAVRTVPAS